MLEMTLIQKVVIWALPLIFAITVHEVAHGWVASKFGDQTARLSGRLTLNPVSHIDLVGTVLLPLLLLSMSNFVFGWAKPVPVDPRNFRKPRRDTAIVAMAGPVANLLMALMWALLAKAGIMVLDQHNSWLGTPLLLMGGAGIMINVVLAVLNLIPFPPLDGSKILYSLLPARWVWHLQRMEPFAFIVLLALWVTGVLSFLLEPPVVLLIQWISQIFNLHGLPL